MTIADMLFALRHLRQQPWYDNDRFAEDLRKLKERVRQGTLL